MLIFFESTKRYLSKYCLLILILLSVILLTKGINHGDFWTADDSHHAMNGVFLLDFLKDFPIFHILDYSIQYYAKYPALSIGIYPPFFAFVEAGFFAVFGISILSAKITVLFFAVIAVIFWFKLIELIFEEKTAFFSTLLFISTPFIVKWSKAVMLEMPAMAMIILSAYFFYNYTEHKKPKHLYFLIFSTAAAIFTKQTAVFLLPFFVFYILFSKKYKLLVTKDAIIIISVLFLFLIPSVILILKFGKMNIAQVLGSTDFIPDMTLAEKYLFYPKTLSQTVTKPVFILSIIYIFSLFIYNRSKLMNLTLFIAWILGYYLVFSLISVKTQRYFFFCIPPFTLFATLMVNDLNLRIKNIQVNQIILALLCVYQFQLSFSFMNSFIDGYEEAARYILNQNENTVLFHGSGVGTGNFIFHIRKFDKARKIVVLRGDKIFASSALYPHIWLEEYIHSQEEGLKIVESLGIKYFVVEKTSHYEIRAFKILRNILSSKYFTLVKEIKLNAVKTSLKGESLLIYKIKKEVSSNLNVVKMKLPIINAEITVPLKALFNFYTPSDTSISTFKPRKSVIPTSVR